MRRLALLLILLTGTVAHPHRAAAAPPQDLPQDLPRGVVVERVATRRDAEQSYALYLPTSYTPERHWPVLYCFDPAGRGAVPVRLFSEAAERFGWVVVGSHNSRNGPLKPALEAVAALLEDTQARLSVDTQRLYGAGFSGGARIALRVHQLCRQCMAGIVAVGAGYPPDMKPTAPLTLALFAAAGSDDYNYPELLALDATFARLGAPHRFESFEGGHAWLTPALAGEALEWLELQAIREGRRPRDEAFVARIWERRWEAARRQEAGAQLKAAYHGYESLAADFRGLRDVAEAAARAAALGETKEVKAALKEEGEQVRRQERLTAELFTLIERRGGADEERAQAAADFRRLRAQLREQAQGAEDNGARRVARRTLNQVFARFYEHASNLRDRRAGAGAVAAALEVAAELAPQSARVFYELAVARALNSERKRALAALRQAVENGFADAPAIEAERAFDRLRADDEFKQLVERIKP